MLQIDVFSDIACPWCFIGKRRLAKALVAWGERPTDDPATEGSGAKAVVEVRWRAFELQPQLPSEGVDAETFFRSKFGTPSRMRAAFEQVSRVGAGDGIRFRFDLMTRAPNTRLAHRVIRLASDQGTEEAANATVEALFQGHFEEGTDVARLEAVLDLLSRHRVPLDLADLQSRLEAGEGLAAVEGDERQAAELGITGVPFFIVRGKAGALAASGAQPPEAFLRLFQAAAEG